MHVNGDILDGCITMVVHVGNIIVMGTSKSAIYSAIAFIKDFFILSNIIGLSLLRGVWLLILIHWDIFVLVNSAVQIKFCESTIYTMPILNTLVSVWEMKHGKGLY